jgi:hypothetical protein
MSDVTEFRERYRASNREKFYSAYLHIGLTNSLALGGIAYSISQLAAISGSWSWLGDAWILPVTFLYGNLAEYSLHRWVMHRKRKYLFLLFERHVLNHHFFFSDQRMACDAPSDYRVILFPTGVLTLFATICVAPVAFALNHFLSPASAHLFTIGALTYFLNYEWFHLAYHQSETSWAARLPGMRSFQALHRTHHDKSLMSRYNFNITYPVGDLIFGTYRKDK